MIHICSGFHYFHQIERQFQKTDLLEQDVTYPLDVVVPVSLGLGRAVSQLLHGSEEAMMEDEQLVQTGEDPLHRFCV